MGVTSLEPRAEVRWVDGGRVGVVLLDGGPANVLTLELLHSLTEALDRIDASDSRALVIGSAVLEVFASGGDLELVNRANATRFVGYLHALREVLDRVDGLGVASIAAIDGHALAAGMELALACTLRVAGDHARLGFPQVRRGTIPAAGGTQRLPRAIGYGRALDLLVTGRTVLADEAFAMGLVDRRAPQGKALDVAIGVARDIAAASLPAVGAVRRAAQAATRRSFPEGMAVEAREALSLFEHGESREGVAAFLEHRPPKFT